MRTAVAVPLVATLGLVVGVGCPILSFDLPEETTPVEPCTGFTCNDGNDCTDDSCDLATGECVFAPRTGQLCDDDANACNGVNTCDDTGACVEVIAPKEVTSDNDPCTVDACDIETGFITYTPIDDCNATTPGWQSLPSLNSPSPRYRHTAIWTGTRMIVWGGRASDPSGLGDGAIYDPVADTWTPMSDTNAPSPRHSHSAVWTGSRMIVWGGFGEGSFRQDGAVYNPSNDTWTAMTTTGAPQGRTNNATIWTGTEMIVWGGLNGAVTLRNGGRYNLGTDTWTATNNSGSPTRRMQVSASYNGSVMMVWGGTDTFDWLGNGGYYDVETNSWTGNIESSGAPSFRESASGVWIGGQMFVWGGWNGGPYLNDGGLLDPGGGSSGAWQDLDDTNAPSPRAYHLSLWTGGTVFVWGGCGGMVCQDVRDDGGIWTPNGAGGTWSPVLASSVLTGRVDHRGVWTGSEVIVFGGRSDDTTAVGDGARAELATF